jgi:small-conductance mechanosensitive channel
MTISSGAAALPQQLRATFDSFGFWLRTDSLDVLIAVGTAVGIFFALMALRRLGCSLLGKGATPAAWRVVAHRVAQKTHGFFLAALAAEAVTIVVAAPGPLLDMVQAAFTIAAVIQVAIWVRELILVVIARRAQQGDTDHSALTSAMGIIRLLVTVVIGAIAIILIFDNLGVNVTGLVAGLGIGGIAIGLAAQGIFSDLFAALAILFDRPFRVGDTVQFGQTTGKVEQVGLKTTRFRALSGEQVVMSNTKLLDQEIRNLRRIEERRVLLILPLAPDTPAEKLAEVPGILQAVVKARKNTRFDHAVLINLTGNSNDIELTFHVTKPDAEVMAQARHHVLVEAKRALGDAGIEFTNLTPARG